MLTIILLNTIVVQAAGLLMLAFGIAAAAKPVSVVEMLSYTGEVTEKAKDAGFDLAGIIQNSAVFLIIMGAVVSLVGLFGCIGACCKVRWMLAVVSTIEVDCYLSFWMLCTVVVIAKSLT